MTDLYMHHQHVAALDDEALTARALALQDLHSEAKNEIARIRSVITATRSSGTYNFVAARARAAEAAADAALTGVAFAAEDVPVVPSDAAMNLTVEGLNTRLAALISKVGTIKSNHRVCIINLAKRHAATAGKAYLEARDQFVAAASAMKAIDDSMALCGLPSTEGIYIQNHCELPILASERKPGEAGWTIRLTHLMDTVPNRALSGQYRESLEQLGLVLKLVD
jgi:hypothetical protein